MSLLDKIKIEAAKRRTKECTIFNQPVLCVLHSKRSCEDLQEQFSNSTKATELLVEQFLDPATNKPFLTVDFLENDCSQTDFIELINLFGRMNGRSENAVEEAEKN
jgi:hypothetical protein